MKSIERELRSYVQGTERMSGADDYAEGDMSYFDDDSSFDSSSYADGAQAMPLSDPYVVQYTNTTASNATAILYGYNDYFNTAIPSGGTYANFGNPVAIVITNLATGAASGLGYGRLIAQSNNKNFKIGKWRFQSTTASQLQVTLTVNYVDADGVSKSFPIILPIMKDSYQQITDQIDVTRPVTVDANTYITFTLVASATIVITMFPVAIISGKSRLNGGPGMGQLKAPRLSALNTSPVIIQTSDSVKSITKG
jgi:hypothetical protein